MSLFFSPRKPGPGGLIWGIGPDFYLPTATDALLGAEKWGLGPTALALRQDKGWTYGALANHIWSFAGDDSRQDINSTYLQPFLSYQTKANPTFGLNLESTYDWENNQWTVPANATVSQLVTIGKQPVSFVERTTNEERTPNMQTISTMRTRTTLTTAVFLAVSAVFLGTLTFGSAHAQQGPASGTLVTQENYCRAENSRMFAAGVKRAGGVNRFDHFRSVTPLDQQTAVRMNKDVLYSSAIVDMSKGATLTIPEMPDGRYFSVLLLDNDHYTPGTIYTPGTHTLPQDTKYLGLILRIHLLRPDDPADVALVNKLQDQFVVKAGSPDPFPEPEFDKKSLEEHTAKYNAEFARYDKHPDEWMGPRGVANDKTRHLACAGAWGLFPNKDAVYINYNGKIPANQCHTPTYTVPEKKGFWSITVYGADGSMKNANSVLNQYNTMFNPDGTFTAYFGSEEICGDVPNRLDAPEGWNFLMRVYRPGESVLHGSYKLPDAVPAKK